MTGTRRALICAGIVVVGLLGCGPPNNSNSSTLATPRQARGDGRRVEPMPHEPCVGSGGEETRMAVGTDRPVPVVEVRRAGRLFCRETDANFDGRVDITRFFDEQGRVRRVEDDYDFDGKVDVVALYREGEVTEDVLDTNFDGRTDTWRNYRGGRVATSMRDSNSDGVVDLWEDFDERGTLVRTRSDADGDGQPDAEDGGARPASADASSSATPAPAADAMTQPPTTPAASADGGQP
jgi:hypothetical protein